MQTFLKRPYGSQQSFDHHSADDVGMRKAPMQAFDYLHSIGSNELRSIDQSKALLGTKLKRIHTRFLQKDAGINHISLHHDFALTYQREKQMRKRRQVTGSANGTLRRHNRNNIIFDMP